jgi:hypothetical protein
VELRLREGLNIHHGYIVLRLEIGEGDELELFLRLAPVFRQVRGTGEANDQPWAHSPQPRPPVSFSLPWRMGVGQGMILARRESWKEGQSSDLGRNALYISIVAYKYLHPFPPSANREPVSSSEYTPPTQMVAGLHECSKLRYFQICHAV